MTQMTTSIPFNFVFDYLPDSIVVKKMFGMHYIYLGKKDHAAVAQTGIKNPNLMAFG